ncbi:unnamed protein product [Closterium sp. NIES-53]
MCTMAKASLVSGPLLGKVCRANFPPTQDMHGRSAPADDLISRLVATLCFAELIMVSTPTCVSLACHLASVDFVDEAIVRRATKFVDANVDFVGQGHMYLQRTRPVRLHSRDVEDVGDEDLLPGLPLQSDGAMAFDGLQWPVEAVHVTHVTARLHMDEGLLRPHEVVGAATVEQLNRRVHLHGGYDRFEAFSASRANETVGSTTLTIGHDASLLPQDLPPEEESTFFVNDVFFDTYFSLCGMSTRHRRPPSDFPRSPLASPLSLSSWLGHSKDQWPGSPQIQHSQRQPLPPQPLSRADFVLSTSFADFPPPLPLPSDFPRCPC